MNKLGDLYYDGKGVAQDYGNAREWCQKAADAGNTDAKQALDRLRRLMQEKSDAGQSPTPSPPTAPPTPTASTAPSPLVGTWVAEPGPAVDVANVARFEVYLKNGQPYVSLIPAKGGNSVVRPASLNGDRLSIQLTTGNGPISMTATIYLQDDQHAKLEFQKRDQQGSTSISVYSFRKAE
jgi:hypothetical protein